jgi:hypothetical protein
MEKHASPKTVEGSRSAIRRASCARRVDPPNISRQRLPRRQACSTLALSIDRGDLSADSRSGSHLIHDQMVCGGNAGAFGHRRICGPVADLRDHPPDGAHAREIPAAAADRQLGPRPWLERSTPPHPSFSAHITSRPRKTGRRSLAPECNELVLHVFFISTRWLGIRSTTMLATVRGGSTTRRAG